MSLVTLSSLPDPVLHLISVYLAPDRPSVNDVEEGQQSTLYRHIINLSLTAHSLNRISSIHIAKNISLTVACTRWDLFLRTVTSNPTYASTVKYLKMNEGTIDDHYGKRMEAMLTALSGLEALYMHHSKRSHANAIQQLLTSKPLPLWDTLQVLRFDHTNKWGEPAIVQLNFERKEIDKKNGLGFITGTELLTGELEDLSIHRFLDIPVISGVKASTRDFENDGDDQDDADWVDEEEDEEADEDSDGWSERDYEDNSEESDWDSEDESDYEDDWEAEYGFAVPKAEPSKDLPVPNTAVVVPGKSLLDF
ncbi:hypothetical protein BKA58DRAFT_43932 [Alternaria rosae]|uniref:uncharacterized protein n=1 Tax=Alternaria rosae TaxID=1187941 RepID=UPI001E8E9326|nr:uncharacterized protein BKA58DRAFT_43932 [Alternaria rosae]KAH6860992.1 hypothetical protein BKA58DRAFT_43932 [Alternaria rosae]